jgi:hypothetical protein
MSAGGSLLELCRRSTICPKSQKRQKIWTFVQQVGREKIGSHESFLIAVEMGHLPGKLEVEFDIPGVFAIEVPGCLENELSQAVFLVTFHKSLQLGSGRFRMAIKNARADKFFPASIAERPDRPVVHTDDRAILITGGDFPWEFFDPGMKLQIDLSQRICFLFVHLGILTLLSVI